MKDVRDLFKEAMAKMIERGHVQLYVAVDVHGTIIKPSKMTVMQVADGADLPSEVVCSCGVTPEFEYYPYAQEVLRRMSDAPFVRLILWTSTQNTCDLVKELERGGVFVDYLNQNPDFQFTPYADFSKKFYFDILLDDKAGFEPEKDWEKLLSVDFEEFSVGNGKEKDEYDDDDEDD